jgi:type IV pilus assembly protein PilE
MKHVKGQQGFTLMELMITVAVVGILAAIAYPSFTEQIARSRRTEAQTILVAGQQWMERFYSENYRYDQTATKDSGGNTTAVTCASSTKDCPFDMRFTTSPPPGQGAPLYAITVSAPTPSATVPPKYVITATRKAGTSMAADRCGNMTVDNLGRRSIETGTYTAKAGSSLSAAIAYCWK